MDVTSIGLIEDEDILLDLASLALSNLDHENTDIVPYCERGAQALERHTIRTEQDMSTSKGSTVKDGDRIDPADIPSALTRAPFTYADGATQVFTADGRTVYREKGKPSFGEWKVDDDGRFQSFWPPSEYTTYDVTWIAGSDGEAVGIRFADPKRGAAFDGRYTRG